MPLYEFKCRTCDDTFEVRRPMSQASDPATCPAGHDGAVRLLPDSMDVNVHRAIHSRHGNEPNTNF